MLIYRNKNISISTIEENDKYKVLEYFSENSFNCSPFDNDLRPTNTQFLNIMDNIIKGKDDESNIFVLKKDGEVIGYESMFVEYGRLIIGHIAVKKEERNKGYGQLLTELAVLIAELEGRDVSLFCKYKNSYLKKIGFETNDDIHYLYKRKKQNKEVHMFFISVEEYRKRKQKEMEEETKSFAKFLESGIMDMF
ncbi:MAG: GNAT family N-acetyltransferase [Firmicutes bacterium]|nr:GNAT family N-acetyltransferase [Bacillota bacterium]